MYKKNGTFLDYNAFCIIFGTFLLKEVQMYGMWLDFIYFMLEVRIRF